MITHWASAKIIALFILKKNIEKHLKVTPAPCKSGFSNETLRTNFPTFVPESLDFLFCLSALWRKN